VPRIDDRFLDCSIYLYVNKEDAEKGHNVGASGVLVAMFGAGDNWQLAGQCPDAGFHHCYAVTNRHVCERCPTILLNREPNLVQGRAFSIIDDATWVQSQICDIAIASIPFTKGNRYLFVSTEQFVTPDAMKHQDIGIGDETFMVGRYNNRQRTQRNGPAVRWGHVAKMPIEPADSEEKDKYDKCFVVEIHSISGFSGSPVFVRPRMAAVVPAWEVLALLNCDAFKQQRRLEQEQLLAKHHGIQED
jgi:hypothetical protein